MNNSFTYTVSLVNCFAHTIFLVRNFAYTISLVDNFAYIFSLVNSFIYTVTLSKNFECPVSLANSLAYAVSLANNFANSLFRQFQIGLLWTLLTHSLLGNVTVIDHACTCSVTNRFAEATPITDTLAYTLFAALSYA